MTNHPDLHTITAEKHTANGNVDRVFALRFVHECVTVVWDSAWLTAREAIAAVESTGDPRPEVHLHEAQQWVSRAQLWYDKLLYSRDYEEGVVKPYALAVVMSSPEGTNCVASAEKGLTAARDALAWAREQTGVDA